MIVLVNALLVSLASCIPFKKFNIKTFLMSFAVVTILFTLFDNIRLLNERSLIVEKFNNIDWTTNNGECPMDKLKLTKNPNNNEHTLEYKRKDREVYGEPVVFPNKHTFDNWWQSIKQNIPAVQSCQLEIPVSTPAVLEQNTSPPSQTIESALQDTTAPETNPPATNPPATTVAPTNPPATTVPATMVTETPAESPEVHLHSTEKKYKERVKQRKNEINKIMVSDDVDVEKVINVDKINIPKPFEENNSNISKAEDQYTDEFKKQIELLQINQDKQNKDLSHYLKYGYSFLPPEYWNIPQMRTPVCMTEKRCAVCPMYTETNFSNLMTDDVWKYAVVNN